MKTNAAVWTVVVVSVASVAAAYPQRRDAAGVLDGRLLFMANCASCHGASATGDGPAAPALRARPADLTKMASRNGNLFPSAKAHRIIDGRDVGAHGNPDMPVWGTAFKMQPGGASDEDVKARIAAIVRYLESIQERSS